MSSKAGNWSAGQIIVGAAARLTPSRAGRRSKSGALRGQARRGLDCAPGPFAAMAWNHKAAHMPASAALAGPLGTEAACRGAETGAAAAGAARTQKRPPLGWPVH